MTTTPTDRETVERIIAREPMLTSMPPQETEVAKTLRALLDERDAAVARAEAVEMAVGARDALLAGCREDRASLEAEVERLRRILKALRDADERGQGQSWQEAMQAVHAALGDEGE